MSGRWVYRFETQHRCNPTTDKNSHAEDIWQCNECSRYWIVREIVQGGHFYFQEAGPLDLARVNIQEEGN